MMSKWNGLVWCGELGSLSSAEPLARLHRRAPGALRGAEEGERRPASQAGRGQPPHRRGAAGRTPG